MARFKAFIESDGDPRAVVITVPPHPSKKMGIDTTKIYAKKLDESKRFHHTVRNTYNYLKSEEFRSVRKSDVIVNFVQSCGSHWHVAIDVVTNRITLKLSRTLGKSIAKKKLDEIATQLNEIFETVTTAPKFH